MLLKLHQPGSQSRGVELINGKYTDTALAASGTTHQPFATFTRDLEQSGIDDLDKLRVSGRYAGGMHF
jgi:hypothetical protein